MIRVLRALGFALVAALVLCLVAGAPSTAEAKTAHAPVAPPSVLGWSSSSLSTMASEEKAFGVRNGMISVYTDFAGRRAFPYAAAAAARARHAALLVSWEPWDSDAPSGAQKSYRPAAITAGAHDPYIRSWLRAAQARAVAGTVMVRFAPEMNDMGHPWSVAPGANTPEEYRSMWRHVWKIKRAVAPDVIFVWNPLNYGAGYPMADAYPGAAYVDMLALDGFNWGQARRRSGCGWQSYEDIFGEPVAELRRLAAGKPWGIAEVASAPDRPRDFAAGGPCARAWGWARTSPANPPFERRTSDWVTQEGWTATLFRKARADGALFVNLFHMNKETDWRVSDTALGRNVVRSAARTGGWAAGDRDAAAALKAAVR